MVSRFKDFTEEERDIMRRSLRRFADDLLYEQMNGLTDSNEMYLKVSALLFEVVKM